MMKSWFPRLNLTRTAGLGAVCLMLLTSAADGQEIQWRSVDAAARVDRAGADQVMSSAEAAHAMRDLVATTITRRVVVQFASPMSPEDRARLQEAGVSILSPLGSNAFFATVDRRVFDQQAVAAVNTLQLVKAVDRDVKLHRLIRDDAIGDWAIVGDTVSEADERGEVVAEPIVAISVLFHRDVERGQSLIIAQQFGATVVSQLQTVNALILEVPKSQIENLADHDAVQWIELPLPGLTELNLENREATQTDIAQESPYNLDGTDVTVMVFDSGTALTTHDDFGGRVTAEDGTGVTNHATHVSGTVAGDGASSGGELRGMAPNATVVSYGFEWGSGGIFLYTNPGDLEEDYSHAINVNNAVIANNSIGTNTANNFFPCEITGEYGITDAVIDAVVRGELGAPIRVIWANGNERGPARCGQEYHTTAPPACAKNHVTVGALNSDDDSVTSFTSWGPAKDGRLKPDLSAPGCQTGGGVTSTSSSGGYSTHCGTSMASPTVAGIAALIMQDYRDHFPDRDDMLPATLRALLIHNARDIENVGPDYQTGYGLVQVVDTIDFMRTDAFMESSITHGETHYIQVEVTEPNTQVKATLVWSDPPGTPNVIPALVNDLDLRITGPDGTFYPWTLDPENPAEPAVQTQPDRLNNIEQVVVDAASPGLWTIEVIGYNIPEGPQEFSLAASPNLVTTGIDFPDGVPAIVSPATDNDVTVRILATGESVIEGSATLYSRINGGDFTASPLIELGDDLYQAALPPVNCDDQLEFYFTVESTLSGQTFSPSGAPDSVYQAEIGELIPLFTDDFNEDLGWTVGAPDDDAVEGIWELADPVGTFVGATMVQPDAPYVGSMCYITGQHPGGGAGANDIDHGKTTLFTPVFDVSDAVRAEISYVRWYSNSAGANPNNDIFEVDISDDGGQTWANVETIGPDGPETAGGWFHHQFAVEDFVELTDQVQVRFVGSDYDPQALVEAAVDMFRLRSVVCEDVCPADLSGDGVVDVADLLLLLSAWGECEDGSSCPADLTGSGNVGVGDMLELLAQWGACQ